MKLTDQSNKYKRKADADDLSDATDYSVNNNNITNIDGKNGVNIISEVEMFDSEEEYRPDPKNITTNRCMIKNEMQTQKLILERLLYYIKDAKKLKDAKAQSELIKMIKPLIAHAKNNIAMQSN